MATTLNTALIWTARLQLSEVLDPNRESSMVAQPVPLHRLNRYLHSGPTAQQSTCEVERDVRYPDLLIADRAAAASPAWANASPSSRCRLLGDAHRDHRLREQ